MRDHKPVSSEIYQINAMNSDSLFIFTSKQHSLTARGIECIISNVGHNCESFIETIKEKLSALKSTGIENPIVIGSIPFDVKQATELFVPKSYQFTDLLSSATPDSKSKPQMTSLKQVTNESHYKGAVNKALSLFEQTQLDKVVLSRAIDVETSHILDAEVMANTLYQQNPDAYVFCIPQSNGKTLIGASPELLIKKQGVNVFSNPLAGSRKRVAEPEAATRITHELWHCEKDRYEHKLVADAVEKGLSPYCSSLSAPQAPSVINTPTMWHLSTKFSGNLMQDISVLELAYDLHPTPAVCGTAKALAKATIKELEGYDREQFCGAVGWMDSEGNGEWVVTIRCGVMSNKSIRLYAGAGVVAGSDPESEFQETEAKLNTMLNAFGLNHDQVSANQVLEQQA